MTNRILETFGKPRVLLPVIHCISPRQAKQNADLALKHGADGLFFIGHGGSGMQGAETLRLARDYSVNREGVFVGINRLGVRAVDSMVTLMPSDVLGLWSDNAGCDTGVPDLDAQLAHVNRQQAIGAPDYWSWQGLYFGGVAFKYQGEVSPSMWGPAALAASRAGVDVVTTSGAATGAATPVEKVAAMRTAIGDHGLAVASGVTIENVGGLLPYVDAYLVASGLETAFGWLDPGRVEELAKEVHRWPG